MRLEVMCLLGAIILIPFVLSGSIICAIALGFVLGVGYCTAVDLWHARKAR